MCWHPRDVLTCTVWEFWQIFVGWRDAHCGAQAEPLSRGEFDDLLRNYNPNGG